ncbi:MAG: hypothetical protein BZ137_04745 [Methanosphaera sp. rholeuAM130]|nr:hypothetical protein [Methanosphaera sp.]RAP53980.1 MAG: hypothetical protein BZ137_04745 [Methanosphaera sp. rholeuAM130]
MINTRLAYLEPKSVSKISTVMTFIICIIGLIIFLIAMGIVVAAVPQLKEYLFTNYITYTAIGIIIGLILTLLLTYVSSYINALLYNYLMKYFKGIQFELTPYNEIKEIDIIPSLSIFMILTSIWFIVSGILLFLASSVVLSLLSQLTSRFANLDLSTITVGSLTVVTLIVLLSIVFMGILALITMFIFNFYTRRNPLKIEVLENNGLELKSINVISYVMSIGLTLLTIELIRTVMNIMVGGSMEVALLTIINTIAICIIYTASVPAIYNFVASKIGGLKFDIEPSSNMIQEYPITENLPNYNIPN